ncbi:hypothetical protein BDV97DRAFT_395654 [Delphinella strobiligena]|nr:hypothetical protein BDV97DRAFT_395654 [Delphinella strobiligena]
MGFHGIMQQLQSQTTGNGYPQVALLKDQLETKDRRIANLEESLEYATAKEKEISNTYIAKLNSIGGTVEKLVADGFCIPTDVLTSLRAHTNTEFPPVFMPFDRPNVRTFEGDIALPYQCGDAAKNRDASGGAANINPARVPLLRPLKDDEVSFGPSRHDKEYVTGSGPQRTGRNTEPLGAVHRHINPKGHPSLVSSPDHRMGASSVKDELVLGSSLPAKPASLASPATSASTRSPGKPRKRTVKFGRARRGRGDGAAAHHAFLPCRNAVVPSPSEVPMALMASAAPSDFMGCYGSVKRHGDAIDSSPEKRRRMSGVLTPPTRDELEEGTDNVSGKSTSSLGSNASLFRDPDIDKPLADKPTIKGKERATLGTFSSLDTMPGPGPASTPDVSSPSLAPKSIQVPHHSPPVAHALSNLVLVTGSASIKDRYEDLDSMIQQVQQDITNKMEQHTSIKKHQETVVKQRSPEKKQKSPHKKQGTSPNKQHTPIKQEHHTPVKQEQHTPSKKHQEAVPTQETSFTKPSFSYANAQGGNRPGGKGLPDLY